MRIGAAHACAGQADPDRAVSLSELVLLGAERKVELLERARADREHRAELRERFLEHTRSGEGIDWEAALAVHERGWAHAPDG